MKNSWQIFCATKLMQVQYTISLKQITLALKTWDIYSWVQILKPLKNQVRSRNLGVKQTKAWVS